MSLTVVVPAAATQLTILERVKAELGISATTDDEMLEDVIDRASSAISRECRRVFGRETVLETLDGTGSRLLGLTRTPIISITTITEDGVGVASSDYSIEDAAAGAVYRADGWGRSGGLRMWGTEAFSSGYILPGYQDLRYAVTYVAGYALPEEASPTLPGAVEQACLETVKAWYRADKDAAAAPAGLKRLTAFSVTLEWDRSKPAVPMTLPPSALGLLRNYYAVALR